MVTGGHQTYASSFRQPDGTITRGKGRRRWNVYRLTVDTEATPLFERYAHKVNEKVALIVASETYATQPQLPRNFYGGDAFQQACIDAQDQQFNHILVLSPAHGVISLDDVVPSEQSWEEVIERRIWAWQMVAIQRLGKYLFGEITVPAPQEKDVNWWTWLNPLSRYELTVFGGGFAVRIFVETLLQWHHRMPEQWPQLVLGEWRPGYHVGDFEDDFDFDLDDDDVLDDEYDVESAMQDIDQLLEWATEFVELVNIYVPPTQETWELAPDEALIPVRLLTEMGMDIEDLLDLLTDMTLLLEQSAADQSADQCGNGRFGAAPGDTQPGSQRTRSHPGNARRLPRRCAAAVHRKRHARDQPGRSTLRLPDAGRADAVDCAGRSAGHQRSTGGVAANLYLGADAPPADG